MKKPLLSNVFNKPGKFFDSLTSLIIAHFLWMCSIFLKNCLYFSTKFPVKNYAKKRFFYFSVIYSNEFPLFHLSFQQFAPISQKTAFSSIQHQLFVMLRPIRNCYLSVTIVLYFSHSSPSPKEKHLPFNRCLMVSAKLMLRSKS